MREMKKAAGGFYRVVRADLKKLAVALLGAALLGVLLPGAGAAAGDGKDPVALPVVMYHSLLKDPAMQGKYVLPPDTFEEDVRYLLNHGYTPVLPEALVAYTRGGSLPEKPVVLTFDDGYLNNYTYAFEIARRYGVKFLLSPIGKWADEYTAHPDENPAYAELSWPRLREMAASGLVELGNHTYDLHRTDRGRTGAGQKKGEGEAAYRALLMADLQKAQEAFRAHTGKTPAAFVFPFGARNRLTDQIVREAGFAVTFTCAETVSTVTRDPESLFGLGRFRRPLGMSAREFFEDKMGLEG